MKLGSEARERLRREAADWFARMRGPVGEADRDAFRRWHDADPAHAEAYHRVETSYGSAGLLAQSSLGRSRSLPERPQRSSWPRSYAVAAGLAALLLASGAVLLGRPEILMPPAEAEALLYATTIGEIREVPLPDGSQMTLDTQTALRVDMSRDVRRVTLREGRARFAVSGRDERPFVVEAGELRVTGQDTIFDVRLEGKGTTVQPIKGAVSVASLKRPAESVRLAPGQLISVSASGARAGPRQASRSETWPTGMLEFDNVPMERVVAEANRYSRARISLGDASLPRLRVSGTFRAGDIEGLARALEAAFGLRLEREHEEHFILHTRSNRAADDP